MKKLSDPILARKVRMTSERYIGDSERDYMNTIDSTINVTEVEKEIERKTIDSPAKDSPSSISLASETVKPPAGSKNIAFIISQDGISIARRDVTDSSLRNINSESVLVKEK